MNVPSYAFLAFGAVVAAVIACSQHPAWRRAVLFCANVAFLLTFTHDLKELAPFLAFLALGFAALRIAEASQRRFVFVVLLVLVIAAFCVIKRYAFVPHQTLLPFAYFSVGISYIFFRILHLVIDGFQKTLPDRVDVLSYLNYTLEFSALVAGPIQFYRDYRRTESLAPLRLTDEVVGFALSRIVMGLFKVDVAAPVVLWAQQRAMTAITSESFAWAHTYHMAASLLLYPIFLYLNFSGYTDAVIGVARFLRLELPENFRRPFAARGFIEFWGRWHMTLSTWLKTYVYSPLVMTLMRRYPSRRSETSIGTISYFVTFTLVGIWHGQTPEFLIFGLLQGIGVSANKLYQSAMLRRLGRARYNDVCAQPLYAACSRALTFLWFATSLLWFQLDWHRIGRFAIILGPAQIISTFLLAFTILAGLYATWAWLDDAIVSRQAMANSSQRPLYVQVAWSTILAVVTISVSVLLESPAPQVVYKGF